MASLTDKQKEYFTVIWLEIWILVNIVIIHRSTINKGDLVSLEDVDEG